jgi:antitoxin PrlF
MATAAIRGNGQITIPKEVRDALGVVAGDRIEFVAEKEGVYRIIPATRDIRQLKGLLPKPARLVGVEAMGRAVARAASRK